MKRGAERQLTKDDYDEEVEDAGDEDEIQVGFNKAADSDLAKRRIRGLPKRALSGSTPGSTPSPVHTPPPPAPALAPTQPPNPESRFGNFSGFGGTGTPSLLSAPKAQPAGPSAPTTGSTVSSAPAPPAPVSAFGPPKATGSVFPPAAPKPAPATLPSSPSTASPSALPPSPTSFSGAPAISSSASTTAKTLASFLGPSPSSFVASSPSDLGRDKTRVSTTVEPRTWPVIHTEPQPQPHQNGTAENEGEEEEEEEIGYELKYFLCLRGLNISFVNALNKYMAMDPFCDLSSLLVTYQAHRQAVQKEFDEAEAETEKESERSEKPMFGGTSSSKFAEGPASGRPAPPMAFGGSLANASRPTSTEAVPRKPSFSLLATRPPPSASSEQPETTTTTGTEAPKAASAFSFGGSGTDSPFGTGRSSSVFDPASSDGTKSAKTDSAPAPPKSNFAFGVTSTRSDTSSLGGTGSSEGKSSTEPSSKSGFSFLGNNKPATNTAGALGNNTSAFGLHSGPSSEELFGVKSNPNAGKRNIWGASDESGNQPTGGFSNTPGFGFMKPSVFDKRGEEKKDSEDKAGSGPDKADQSVFGTGGFAPEAVSSPPRNALAFGAKTPPKSSFNRFGSPSSAVGFVFGKPSESSEVTPQSKAAGTVSAFGPASAPVSNSGSAPALAPSSTEEGEEAEGGEVAGGAVEEKKEGPNPHDMEGEGEEGEETTHEVRCKVYKWDKGSGQATWREVATGMLRLKRHKENEDRRVLLRNSSSGRVVINFKIYSTLTPILKQKQISFIAHENGAAVPFNVRVKTEQAASDLKAAMDREIEFVRGKTEETLV